MMAAPPLFAQTNWKFDARSFCSTRTYEYYLPAFLLGEART